MPLISVIVPVYKVENYIHRCVGSLLAQTFRAFELILVDDGSPDRCGEICEEYAANHPWIHVIHQENGGLSAARNTGIEWALKSSDSEYLAFVDSDDWVSPVFLEMLVRAARETGCPISVCGLERTAGEPLPEAEKAPLRVLTPEEYYSSGAVHGGVTAVAWNKLYRKELFREIRYPVGKLHEDEFTTYRLIYGVDAVAVLDAKLYAYFQNDQGIMRSSWSPKRMHALEAMEQQIQFALENRFSGLLKMAVEKYLYATADQLARAEKNYHGRLRKNLRRGLALSRKHHVFAPERDVLWMYELAYPARPLWWLVFRIRAWTGR